ncbi:MAG TPA: Lrp/AsnC family transcriptional regulator [Candidatus Eubacterium faecigallinarum]|nr:Lrp/AsnC family transcriptional regulator [Candidatus Eubacterium faecigallinarum]
MDKLLNLIEKNPRLSNKEIAVMLGIDEKEVEEKIRLYEDTGVIKGYRAMIDKDKAQAQTVTALIEIKVHPKFEHGFDEVAQQISSLEEVESVYLMSGGFDLCCMVTDKSFQEVALFVASRLAPMESVMSTATHFILKKYKEQGVLFSEPVKDDRGNISL